MRAWARSLGVPALVVVPCLALYFTLFMPAGLVDKGRGSILTSFDLVSYFLPRMAYGSQELFRGRLPTWNPFEYAGLPFLATSQPEVFYPPKILLFGLLPMVPAYWAYLSLHFVALAASMLLFLRARGFSGAPAAIGTVLWTFASPVLASNYHPIRIANYIWVPIAFFVGDRLGRGVKGSFAWLALVVALSLSAGYPEWILDFGLLLAVHAVACWALKEWTVPPQRAVPLLGAAFALGGLVAAVQLLPLAEIASVARRTDVASETAPLLAASATRVILDSAPGLLLFAVAGLMVRRGRAAVAGLATCMLMAAGGWLVLRHLPGMSMVRYPWSWRFMPPFFVAWLAAAGAEAFLAEGARRWSPSRIVLAALAAAWTIFAVVAGYRFFRHGLPIGQAFVWPVPIGTAVAAALAVAGGVALSVAGGLLRGRALVPTTLVATVLLVLSHAAAYPFEAVPAPIGPPSPAGEVARLHGYPQEIRGRALSPNDILYGYEITDRIPSVLGAEESFLPWRYRRVLTRLGFAPLLARLDYQAVIQARGFLAAMDMQYLTVPAWLTEYMSNFGFRPVRRGVDVVLTEYPGRMGHAWVNYAARVVSSEEAAEEAVFDPNFDPHTYVVLEEPPQGTYPSETDQRATRPSTAHRRSATETEFVVKLDRPGIFVVSETAYPGWEATVDDRPTRWVTANYVLRAVELPAGSHRIRFVYRPASVRWGLVGSGVGLLLLGLAFVRGRRNRVAA